MSIGDALVFNMDLSWLPIFNPTFMMFATIVLIVLVIACKTTKKK